MTAGVKLCYFEDSFITLFYKEVGTGASATTAYTCYPVTSCKNGKSRIAFGSSSYAMFDPLPGYAYMCRCPLVGHILAAVSSA